MFYAKNALLIDFFRQLKKNFPIFLINQTWTLPTTCLTLKPENRHPPSLLLSYGVTNP